MKKLFTWVLLLSFAFTATGCTGSFNLTKKVYNFHRSQSDKWADELAFLVCVLVPIYGISTFADAILFNSIEFWTGENPVVYNPTDKTKVVKDATGEARISLLNDDKIMVQSRAGGQKNEAIILKKTGDSVVAEDASGNVLMRSKTTANGEVAVYDQNNQVVKTFQPRT